MRKEAKSTIERRRLKRRLECNPFIEIHKEKLREIKQQYNLSDSRGSINAYVTWAGGWDKVFEVFCSYAGFVQVLIELDYGTSYVYRLKKKWQKLFNPEKSE
jgi:hypothetical protein